MLITLNRINQPPVLLYLDSIDYFDGICDAEAGDSTLDGKHHTRVHLKSGASMTVIATIEELESLLPGDR